MITRILPAALALLAFAASTGRAEPDPKEQKIITFPGGGRCFPKDRRIEIDGVAVYPERAPIELFACSQHGKEHEAVIALQCVPQDIHFALLIFGLQDDTDSAVKGPQTLGDPAKPVGDKVLVFVEWTIDGKRTRVRAEDLLSYGPPKDGRTMPQAGWVFAGSEVWERVDPDTNQKTGEAIYMANRERTLMSTYHDPTAVLDNPLVSGGDDRMLHPNFKTLPPRGTKLMLVIEMPTAAELTAMKKIEEDSDKEYEAKIAKEWKEIDESVPRQEDVPPDQREGKEGPKK